MIQTLIDKQTSIILACKIKFDINLRKRQRYIYVFSYVHTFTVTLCIPVSLSPYRGGWFWWCMLWMLVTPEAEPQINL